jgi:hypothetical protein
MDENKIVSFEHYYKNIYLPAHKKRGTRIAHLIGQVVTFVWFIAAIFIGSIIMILLTPLVVYPFAWGSHLLIEKNEPLAFTSVWAAKLADIRMCYEMLSGQIDWGK